MSIATAQRTLNRAFAELKQAQGDQEKLRQAAEKGWRAAREAVYAALRAHGKAIRGTMSTAAIADFESARLRRPRGGPAGQPLTDAYARAKDYLHGEYFYDGRGEGAGLHGELRQVAALIEQAARDARHK